MLFRFLFTALFGITNYVFAQSNLISNYSFENGNGSAVPQCGYYSTVQDNDVISIGKKGHDAFNDDIQDWKVGDKQNCCVPGLCASPDWYGLNCATQFGAPPTGERWLHLFGSDNCQNEIVRQSIQTLIPGYIYSISMKLQGITNGHNHIRVHFTKFGENWDDAENNITGNKKQIDATTFDINTNDSYQIHTWYPVSAQFVASKSELGNIILEMEEGDLFIDDVELVLVGPGPGACCPLFKLYQNTSDLQSHTHVQNFIKAGNNVGAPDGMGDVIIQDGQSVTFKAGDRIEMHAGFIIRGNFTATIEDCNVLTSTTEGPIEIVNFPDIITPDGNGENDELCINVKGATEYSVTVFAAGSGTKVYEAWGPVISNYACVWDGSCNQGWPNCSDPCVIDEAYPVIVVFTNCDHSKNAAQLVEVLGSGVNCRKANFSSDSSKFTDDPPDAMNLDNSAAATTFPLGKENIVINDSSLSHHREHLLIINPNPSVSGIFNIHGAGEDEGFEEIKITVINVLGEAVYNLNKTDYEMPLSIDLSSQPKGVYFLKLRNGEKVMVEKIIYQ